MEARQVTAYDSPTFNTDVKFTLSVPIGAASISPSGRDVVLASADGLYVIDLDMPYSPPRYLPNLQHWDVADVQWSPFASRADWIASTCNQKALIYNLNMNPSLSKHSIEYELDGHDRAITDINFSAHHPDLLATCAVDTYILTWDLRASKPAASFGSSAKAPELRFADWEAGATQVKWNRKNPNIIASSHDRYLKVWDVRFGAVPITHIRAHTTKIYGIDWNRTDANKIMTCSLDHTIKLWDTKSTRNIPEQTIHTGYPVWRARHTPFANGILAMPQRGASGLCLYDKRGLATRENGVNRPAHVFNKHAPESRILEFLWRTRGSAEGGIDNREFQLVSWGDDQCLHLHRVDERDLERAVGFSKGQPVVEEPSFTRLGAAYVTYRDGPVNPAFRGAYWAQNRPPPPIQGPLQGISALMRNAAFSGLSAKNPAACVQISMTGPRSRNESRRVVNTIKWMSGVQMGRNDGGRLDPPNSVDDPHMDATPTDLASEINYVSAKFPKVNFEKAEVHTRVVVVYLKGPWGVDKKEAALRANIRFPTKYPFKAHILDMDNHQDKLVTSLARVELERTTDAIPGDVMAKLREDVHGLAEHYAELEKRSLEAIIGYLLGDRGLEESLRVEEEGDSPEPIPPLEEESSSDEDEDIHGNKHSELVDVTANVPLPKTASAQFSGHGLLTTVRIPPPEPNSLFANHTLSRTKDFEIFESFGRLRTRSPIHEPNDDMDAFSSTSSQESWTSSSSSSSSASEEDFGNRLSKFQPPLAWQKSQIRFQHKTSLPSSATPSKPPQAKSVVSILEHVNQWIPSKKILAEEYQIFGDGPSVCKHNGSVARRHGFEDLGNVWELCGLILNDDVPLDVLPQQYRREQVLVLARRALVRIKRKDSGLDLQFDEADTVTRPKLKGRIKWGHHPFVKWLIPALFEYFERLADIQMLAMLSCVFSEPAAQAGASSAVQKMQRRNLTLSMEAPAFSLDYFASAEAAWSLFKPTISIPSTPAHSRYATPVGELLPRFSKTLDTYGSHGSSNGPWGSDTMPSEPVTPYSTGNTPPNLSRAPTMQSMTSHTPFSSSPEHPATVKKSNSNLATAFASLSRPFSNAPSSSPPVKARTEGDLSTSAPTSGVTWGTTTFYSSGSTVANTPQHRSKHAKRASFGQSDRINIDYYSDTDTEYDDDGILDGSSEHAPPPDGNDGETSIKVTLKNQDKFDDEASVSSPLLDLSKEWLHKKWREQYAEMLGMWGLISIRAEILKFNGLVSYFPSGATHTAEATRRASAASGTPSQAHSQLTSAQLSRSSGLAPPVGLPPFRRSPTHSVIHSAIQTAQNSPRGFSFNPEASEFKPGVYLEQLPEDLLPSIAPKEEHLILNILPPLTPPQTASDGTYMADNTRLNIKGRPPLSRATSIVSTTSQQRALKEPVYSCAICWLRVTGRFYLCAGCGHVAHFDCIPHPISQAHLNDSYDLYDNEAVAMQECMVGCNCGCAGDGPGSSDEDEDFEYQFGRSSWTEKGGWLAHHAGSDSGETQGYGFEGGYGDGMGRWTKHNITFATGTTTTQQQQRPRARVG